MTWHLSTFDLFRPVANILFSWIALAPSWRSAASTPLAAALAQVTNELTLKLAAWVCIDCQVDRFVTHMPLRIIRPVVLESGGNLLRRPALG